jgi:ribosomal protein L17
MRHGYKFKKLGRDPIHRRALFKNLAIALIKHERIVTTLAKAKELRKTGDKVFGVHYIGHYIVGTINFYLGLASLCT